MWHRPAKKSWRQAVDNLRLRYPGHGIGVLSGLFGKSREGYYSVSRERRAGLELTERDIVGSVRELRSRASGIGGYKLHLILKDLYGNKMFGRDRFYRLLHAKGLMLKPQRGRHTTRSNHHFRKFRNVAKGLVPISPRQGRPSTGS